MKILNKSPLFLMLVMGISGSFISTSWSQTISGNGESEVAETWGPDVVQSFPIEPGNTMPDGPPAIESGPTYQTENFTDQPYEQNIVTDDYLFPVVKNVDFFGVDREKCCDEWEGLCGCKTPKYGCGCGGLKANKGHLGIFWLKRKYGGDGCDYCKGGCCEKGCSRKKSSLMKACFRKWGVKDDEEESSECSDETTPNSIFGRPLTSNCRRCGCCEEGCPPQEDCDSCN